MPLEICKMAQFRHIEFVQRTWYLPVPSDMDDVVIMKNLETLKVVRNSKFGEEMLKRIPNIKKLEIYYDERLEGDDPYCFSNIKLLSKLESLHVRVRLEHTQAPHMQGLIFPHSLKSLSLLMSSDFEWEEMLEKIGRLPLLQKLIVATGCFGTGMWEVVEGQFPSLKSLGLYECVGLKQWTVEESPVLPRLEQLHLIGLQELEEIPCEIGDILTLQAMWLVGCSESVVKSAKEIVDEQVEMQGEELSLHVQVGLESKNEELESLASPNFIVYLE